jgi:hypothetical protein
MKQEKALRLYVVPSGRRLFLSDRFELRETLRLLDCAVPRGPWQLASKGATRMKNKNFISNCRLATEKTVLMERNPTI